MGGSTLGEGEGGGGIGFRTPIAGGNGTGASDSADAVAVDDTSSSVLELEDPALSERYKVIKERARHEEQWALIKEGIADFDNKAIQEQTQTGGSDNATNIGNPDDAASDSADLIGNKGNGNRYRGADFRPAGLLFSNQHNQWDGSRSTQAAESRHLYAAQQQKSAMRQERSSGGYHQYAPPLNTNSTPMVASALDGSSSSSSSSSSWREKEANAFESALALEEEKKAEREGLLYKAPSSSSSSSSSSLANTGANGYKRQWGGIRAEDLFHPTSADTEGGVEVYPTRQKGTVPGMSIVRRGGGAPAKTEQPREFITTSKSKSKEKSKEKDVGNGSAIANNDELPLPVPPAPKDIYKDPTVTVSSSIVTGGAAFKAFKPWGSSGSHVTRLVHHKHNSEEADTGRSGLVIDQIQNQLSQPPLSPSAPQELAASIVSDAIAISLSPSNAKVNQNEKVLANAAAANMIMGGAAGARGGGALQAGLDAASKNVRVQAHALASSLILGPLSPSREREGGAVQVCIYLRIVLCVRFVLI